MIPYPKIETMFARDPETKYRTVIEGEYSKPEFRYLRHCPWRATEQIDGTNIRVIADSAARTLEIRGRTDNAQVPPFLVTAIMRIFEPSLSKIYDDFPGGVCFYGEGYGAKIQKGGGNYRADQGFALFDVRVHDFWLCDDLVRDIAVLYNLETPPVVTMGGPYDGLERIQLMVREGLKSVYGDFQAEGIVAKPVVQLFDRNGDRIITKLKTKDFVKEDA